MKRLIGYGIWLGLLSSFWLAIAPRPVQSSGGLFSPNGTPAIHESFSTYSINPLTGLITLNIVQGVRLHGEWAWWIVPVQGRVKTWDIEYGYGASAYMSVLAPPNPCANLLPFYGGGHGEFYDVGRTHQASLIGGNDILAWADDHAGLDDIAPLLAPYTNGDWTFLVDKVMLQNKRDREELFGLYANITYLPSSDAIVVPVELFAASYTDDRPRDFSNPLTLGHIEVHIVATDFYAPASDYVTPDFAQAPLPHALNQDYVLTPFDSFYRLQSETSRNNPEQWVLSFRGETQYGWLLDHLQGAFRRSEIDMPITVQSSIYEGRIRPNQPYPNGVFARQPNVPRYDIFDVTGNDPAQYYGCSTRTLDAGEPRREIDVVPFAALAPDLPPQREYIAAFGVEVFVPTGWVRSEVEIQGLPVVLFSAGTVSGEAVAADDVAAYLAGESAPPMLAVYPGPLTFDEPPNYFPPRQANLDLSAYRTMVSLPTSYHYRFNPAAPKEKSVHLAWLIGPDDYEQNRAMYEAVLGAAQLRRYASHPALLHTLYLKPDLIALEGNTTRNTILLFQIGQPEGYIESIQLDPPVVTFTNPANGSTIEVTLAAAGDCMLDTITPSATARLGYSVVRGGLGVTITTTDSAIDDAILLALAESVHVEMAACAD